MANTDLVGRALAGTPVTIFFQDIDGGYRWFVNPQSVWAASDRVGENERALFGGDDLEALAKAKAEATRTGEPRCVEVTAVGVDEAGHPAQWALRLTVDRAFDQQTGIEGFVCSCIDITERRQREQTLRNLLREVAHRSRNMLAMVLSLSAQTARVAPTKAEYIRRFTGRLQSLARSQDVITDSDWQGSSLSQIVRKQVGDVVPAADGQIGLTGDDIELGPNGTLHVGLALHELVTNALVHGALTAAEGRIAIDCRRAHAGGGGAVLTWTETPRVQSDEVRSKSFGRPMLERIVPAAVDGSGRLELTGDAVIYTLVIGHSQLV